jgi:hypothetical protein
MKRPMLVFCVIFCFCLTACNIKINLKETNDEKLVMAANFNEEEVIEEEKQLYTVKMRVVGDIMTHDEQLDVAYDKNNQTYHFDKQFELIKQYLSEADITIGNLESTFGGPQRAYTGYPQFNTPDSLAQSLKDAGFDLLTTANNHSMDNSSEGVIRTLEVLDQVGIEHIGTYASQEASETIKIKIINNISFAFLSYTYGTNGISVPKDKPYLIHLIDLEEMKKDIEKAEELSPDFIVVFLHFGNEYERYPNKEQKYIVDELFNAGADIILGSHPHVIQPMETRTITRADGSEEEVFVIYSLGNFISSQRSPKDPPRDAGIILNIDFEKSGNEKARIKNISFMPTWVQYSTVKVRGIIRVVSCTAPEEELKKHLLDFEIKRLKETKEYTLKHLLGDKERKLEGDFYIYNSY